MSVQPFDLRVERELYNRIIGRALHSSAFQLNVITFWGYVVYLHDQWVIIRHKLTQNSSPTKPA